jgi:TatD DNase family protein
VENIPLESIVIETDCPYLAPVPNRGKRNDSSNLLYTAQKIAELKNITLEEVARVTSINAEKLYDI